MNNWNISTYRTWAIEKKRKKKYDKNAHWNECLKKNEISLEQWKQIKRNQTTQITIEFSYEIIIMPRSIFLIFSSSTRCFCIMNFTMTSSHFKWISHIWNEWCIQPKMILLLFKIADQSTYIHSIIIMISVCVSTSIHYLLY